MGKYSNDLPSKNPERSVERVEDYLRKQGFWLAKRARKDIWKRDSKTRILSPEYITVTAAEGHVHLEAWVKALTPLPGVWIVKTSPEGRGPIGGSSKQRLRQRLERIEKLVG